MDITQKDVLHKDLQNLIIQAIKNKNITPMPPNTLTKQNFASHFDLVNDNIGIVHTPYKNIAMDINRAWKHFKLNTYGKNRNSIKGGFFETFRDPLFIVKSKSAKRKYFSTYFYKPFYDSENNRIDLFGIGIDSNGNIDFKTYYKADSDSRLSSLLNDTNLTILYIKNL